MNYVLMAGITAWALRFAFFSIGKPLALILLGVAIHGICFDFFFAAGFINADRIAPEGLTATAQQLYGFLVYGMGMFLGSLGAGWLNQSLTETIDADQVSSAGPESTEGITRWRIFWLIPCLIVAVAALLFWFYAS
jgi:hypothetical protein